MGINSTSASTRTSTSTRVRLALSALAETQMYRHASEEERIALEFDALESLDNSSSFHDYLANIRSFAYYPTGSRVETYLITRHKFHLLDNAFRAELLCCELYADAHPIHKRAIEIEARRLLASGMTWEELAHLLCGVFASAAEFLAEGSYPQGLGIPYDNHSYDHAAVLAAWKSLAE